MSQPKGYRITEEQAASALKRLEPKIKAREESKRQKEQTALRALGLITPDGKKTAELVILEEQSGSDTRPLRPGHGGSTLVANGRVIPMGQVHQFLE